MEKIKLEVAGVPAVLYGKRSRKVYLYAVSYTHLTLPTIA